ncbi:MAG TPA: SEC-C domain-containing protein [Rhizomicrobium sp.]|nr:SEC-C domain-containing protein [Rhizomicrobium sp.]
MSKIGRNSPCPCGSGKKYKRCHGSLDSRVAAEAKNIDHIIQIAKMRHEARQVEIERQFGKGRPPIAMESHGYRIVAVGNEVHWSNKWKTFPDFLMDYFKKVLGPDWGKAQLAKDRKDRSPIFEWYAQTCEYQQAVLTAGHVREVEMTGAACGTLWLAYGLYLLRHNVEIQERLLHRVRSEDPVQIFGAVQEILAASALIRAGFELKLEDEGDGTKTHVEFVAASKETGKSFSVEIKVCDPGRLEGRQSSSRTMRQLSRALSKQADHPRLVWIDLNRPPLPDEKPEQIGETLKGENKRIQTQVRNLKVNGGAAPSAYILLSNWPFRYQLGKGNIRRAGILTGIGIAKMGSEDEPFYSLRELAEFRAEHQDMFRMAREFTNMTIPNTLDGSLPAKAFGKPGEKPILIGERYLVPLQDGSEAPGELLSANVNENNKNVMAMVRLDDGSTILCTMPLSDEELALYKDSPETFFGKYEPNNKVEHPVELYEWMLKVYKDTPREKLAEWLKGHVDPKLLAEMPREELVKLYAEGIAQGAAAKMKGWQKKSAF